MPHAAFLAIAGLAGLFLTRCAAAPTAAADPVAACTKTAERAPDVQAVRFKQLAGPYQAALFANDYKTVLNRAIDTCLTAKGLSRPGGVEAVRND